MLYAMSDLRTRHELKTLPEWFQAVIDGRKTAELRVDDREFKEGDLLWLREWSQDEGYSGREAAATVTHVLRDTEHLQPGYALLSFGRVSSWSNGDEIDRLKATLTKTTNERQILARELSRVQGLADDARADLANHCCCTHDGHGNLTSECEEHREVRDDLAREVAHHADTVASLQKVNAALQATQAALEQAQQSWRCFQCGMVLTTEHEARNHFGEKACVSLQHERERQALKQRVEKAEADLADVTVERDEARRELEESWAELRQLQHTHAKELADAQAEALAMRRERDREIHARVEAESALSSERATRSHINSDGPCERARRRPDPGDRYAGGTIGCHARGPNCE